MSPPTGSSFVRRSFESADLCHSMKLHNTRSTAILPPEHASGRSLPRFSLRSRALDCPIPRFTQFSGNSCVPSDSSTNLDVAGHAFTIYVIVPAPGLFRQRTDNMDHCGESRDCGGFDGGIIRAG